MKHEEIQQKVLELIQDQIQTNEPIELTSLLKHDLDFDSLDEIEFIMRLEKEFGISIPDDVAIQIKVVRDAIDTVEKLLPKN